MATKYDDASWHYEGDYPSDLTEIHASTHIGMFVQWCIENDLISTFLQQEFPHGIEQVKSNTLTGAAFLHHHCDGKFTDEDLNALGNAFAADYYNESDFGEDVANYIDDYLDVFDENAENKGWVYETLYHIEDTPANYQLLKPVIDERFQQWKLYRGV